MIPYVPYGFKKTTLYVKVKVTMSNLKFMPLTQQQIKTIALLSENKIDLNAVPFDTINVLKGISLAQLTSLKGKFDPQAIQLILNLI